MKRLFWQHWFLVALIAALTVGFSFAGPLTGFSHAFPRRALVAAVLFLMSWSLDSTALVRALRRPQAAVLGIAVNLVFLPLAAWLVARLLAPPLALGLLLTVALPCTLASAAVWTRRAGGNDAVALLVTMVTNFSCFLVTPLLLWLLTGADVQGSLSAGELVWRLLGIAVFPMLAGQLLRLVRPAARFATRHKSGISTFSQLGILTMVLIGAVESALKLSTATPAAALTPADWLGMLGAVVLIHLAALYLGFGVGRATGLDRGDWIATGLAGSQKTLMIGLDLTLALDLGIGMLTMIAYHVVQLILGTLVADRLNKPPKEL
ncbi:MAG: hypothetical protein GTO53_02175 [Planctomycetales bacterium]|nr:hypothetical protein [Planctomycetales bacterium]NIM07975.1 hypothetical protein [Planctomycetales bacterium]NIN07453.1 hypothetical protein [Planctomycetales bacterium]NIN76559.1 hypothetical protein [Planctomycetales bacterium]NIO33747.1 hypothetical protein [Planctomycetales bacterium]